MTIDEMRLDIAKRSKKGMSFMLTSIVIWAAILIIWLSPIKDIRMKNTLTFFCTALLMPVAFLFSKIIKAEFSVKGNALNSLGILLSMNQFLYILIAMWAYAQAPDKMVMIFAMIFGAHLLPFSWLYKSRVYLVMSIIIPIVILAAGSFGGVEYIFVIPAIMAIFEVVLVIWLSIENRTERK